MKSYQGDVEELITKQEKSHQKILKDMSSLEIELDVLPHLKDFLNNFFWPRNFTKKILLHLWEKISKTP